MVSTYGILYLEDAVDMQLIVKKIFAKNGLQVTGATSAAEAYEILEKGFTPDVILMDLTIPDAAPEEFLKTVRAKHPTLNPAIIVASGRDDLNSVAHEVGALTYLRKPFDVGELVMTIQAILEARTKPKPVE